MFGICVLQLIHQSQIQLLVFSVICVHKVVEWEAELVHDEEVLG